MNPIKIISTCLLILVIVLLTASPIKADNGVLLEGNSSDIFLVEYQLEIIRIDEADWQKLGLQGLKFELDMQDLFSLITANNLLEIAGIGSRALVQLEAYRTEEIVRTVSKPVLVTELTQPVSFKISEKIIELDNSLPGRKLTHDQIMYLSLLPERLDPEGRILTELEFNTGGTSAVETKFWSEKNQMRLIGIITWNRDTALSESWAEGSRSEVATFALYLTHNLINIDHERESNIMTMDGLNRLLWAQPSIISNYPGYIEILSPPEFDLLLLNQSRGLALEMTIKNILQPVIFIGIDGIAYEDLRLGFRVMRNRDKDSNQLEFAPVLNERVFFDPYLEIFAAYYPFFYNMSRAEFILESAYSLGLTLKYHPLSARIKYSSNLGSSELQLMLGYSLSNSVTVLAGVEGSREEIDRYIAGIRVNFK